MPTDTATLTPTATLSPTETATGTPTATEEATATETATVIPTATEEATVIPTATEEATVIPTATEEATATETAIAPPSLPVADFSGEPLSGTAPLMVTFSDASSGTIYSYLWDYGDGLDELRFDAGATHTYQAPGVYTVSLTVEGDGSIDTLTRTHYLTVTVPLQPTPSSTIGDYAVLGLNSVQWEQGSELYSGYVGVQEASPGPMLGSAEVTIGSSVTFHNSTSTIAGDTVKLKQGATVFDIFNNEFEDGVNTNYGQLITPLSLPPVSDLPTLPEINPGPANYEVGQNNSLELSAGAYGEVTLRKNAVLILTGGVYHLVDLNVGDKAQVRVTAPTEIRLANRLTPGSNAVIGPVSGSGLNGSDLVLFVAGINGNSGNLGGTPKAAAIGQHNTVTATIYAPNGTLWLKQGTEARGAFIGRDTKIGYNVQVWLNSAFAGGYQPPASVAANFSATPLSGGVPLVVTFTNTSLNATDYRWNFGDDDSSFLIPHSPIPTLRPGSTR